MKKLLLNPEIIAIDQDPLGKPGGRRTKLPYDVEEEVVQAFAHVSGATGEDEGGKITNWHAFVVGVPSEGDDWIEVRERATYRAIGVR